MMRSRFSMLATAAIAVAACNAAPRVSNAATSAPVQDSETMSNDPAFATTDPSGTYNRTEPANGTLNISKDGANWRLEVTAAGVPYGAGTAADCGLVASGPLVDGRIVAKLVRSEDTGYDKYADEDLEGTITAIVGSGKVVLEEQGASSKYCGMRSDLRGTYTRR